MVNPVVLVNSGAFARPGVITMKIITAIFLLLFGVCGLANAQAQSRGGAFATVPTPGQAPAPTAVTPQPVTPQPPGVARPTTPAQPAQQQQEQLRIVADPATNSLIIYGTAQEFQNIKNILKELDAVPRQVLLDVLIMEVTLDDREDFGVDYEIMRGNTSIFGRTFGSRGAVLGSVLSQLGVANAAGTSLFPGGISGVIGTTNTVRALINALMADSRIKILSSPSVLATDNRPARIQVGSEEPQATGTLTAATGAVSPSSSTTIQYRNTGRIVTIIPQVNSQGLVNLQILAEVSQRGANVTVGQDSFPSFDIRQAETTAVVQDRDTLAIGGIIAENRSRDRRGIPYLMDIPVVGRFFGTTSDSTRRTELIMLITPNVIRNRSEGTAVTDDFKSKLSTLRNELERMERERARSQPKPPPPEIPPPVEPRSEEKPFAPSRFVPQRGAAAPPKAQVTVLSTAAAAHMAPRPQSVAEESSHASIAGDQPQADPSVAGETISAALSPPPSPAYLLSLGQSQAVAPVAVTRPLSERQNERKQNRQWAVQVAALANRKDADAMAVGLQKHGYQAYVMTVQTESKTWHRVRIGQFSDIVSAKQLRESLASALQFKGAYIAAN